MGFLHRFNFFRTRKMATINLIAKNTRNKKDIIESKFRFTILLKHETWMERICFFFGHWDFVKRCKRVFLDSKLARKLPPSSFSFFIFARSNKKTFPINSMFCYAFHTYTVINEIPKNVWQEMSKVFSWHQSGDETTS